MAKNNVSTQALSILQQSLCYLCVYIYIGVPIKCHGWYGQGQSRILTMEEITNNKGNKIE